MTVPISALQLGRGTSIAHFPGITVAVFARPAEKGSIPRLTEFRRAASIEEGRPLRSLMVIGERSFTGDPEVRREGQESGKAAMPYVCAEAHVFMGRGFRVAAIRALVAGVVMATRPPVPLKIYDAPETALEWLLEKNLEPGRYPRDASMMTICAWVDEQLRQVGASEHP